MNKIYVIMLIEKLVDEQLPTGGISGATRIVGWYKDKNTAIEMVKINNADIHEYLYDYVLVEEIEEGFYQPATEEHRWFFKYNSDTDEFEPYEDPKCFEHFCGLTIG